MKRTRPYYMMKECTPELMESIRARLMSSIKTPAE